MNIIYPIIIVVIAYCVLGDGKMLKSLKSEHIVLITLGIWLFTVTMSKQGFIDVPTELGDPQDFREDADDQKLLWWRNPASKIFIHGKDGAEIDTFKGFSGLEIGGYGLLILIFLCGVGVFIYRFGDEGGGDLRESLRSSRSSVADLAAGGGQRGGGKGDFVAFLSGIGAVVAIIGVVAIFTNLYVSSDPIKDHTDSNNQICSELFTTPKCVNKKTGNLCKDAAGNDMAPVAGKCTKPECFPHMGCLATTPTMNTTELAEFKRNNPEYVDISSLASKIGQCEDKYPLSALGHTGSGASAQNITCGVREGVPVVDEESCHKLKIGTCAPNYGPGAKTVGFTLEDATTAAESNDKTPEQSAMVDIHNEITGICEAMNHNKSECEMYADRCIPLQPELATSGWYGGDHDVSCKDQWNSEHICNKITKSPNGNPNRADHRVCRYLDESDSVDAVSLVNLCKYTEPEISSVDLEEEEQRCKWNRDGGLFDGDMPLDETNIENWKYAYYLPLPTLNNAEVTGLLTQLGVNEDSASGWASSIQGDNDIDKKKHLFQYIMDYATHAREVSTDVCQRQGRYKCPQPGGCVEGSCPGGGQVQEDGRCLNGDRPQNCGAEDIDVEDPQSGYCVDDCSYCQNHPHNPIGAQDPEFGRGQWNPRPSVCVSTLNSSSGVTPPRTFACSGNTIPTHDIVCETGSVKGPDSSWKPPGINIPSLAVDPNDTSLTNTCTDPDDPDGGSSCTEHNQDRSTCESNTGSAGAQCVFTANVAPLSYADIQDACCEQAGASGGNPGMCDQWAANGGQCVHRGPSFRLVANPDTVPGNDMQACCE